MRTFTLAIVACLCSASAAFAADSAVFPVKGTNLTEGETAAIGTLLANAYSMHHGSSVLTPADTQGPLTQAGSESEAAKLIGLSEYVEVTAVRLDRRITLYVVLRNQHGSELFRENATATSLDDMEPIADRLAAALHRRTPIEHTQTLNNVIGTETRAPNRTFAEKVFGVRTAFVGAFVLSNKYPDPGTALALQFDGRLEGTTYFLEFAGGFMLPADPTRDVDDGFGGGRDGMGGLIAYLGAAYYLTQTSVSPYVGGGFSPRIMLGDYEGAGLSAGLQLGLMFMRHSSSRIYTEVRLDQHLLPLSAGYDVSLYDDTTGTFSSTDGDSALPTELSLAVGIGW